jgi:hypothetical protein
MDSLTGVYYKKDIGYDMNFVREEAVKALGKINENQEK